jgi:metal-dependent amidase/aminoacylase/carboxypeptidase family protein
MRQHVRPDVRLHGIITNGGQAVNIVPEFAECRIQVRAAKKAYLAEVIDRVLNIARGAALQTGATLDYEGDLPYDDILECPPLAHLLKANMEQLGLTVEDHAGLVTPASSDVGNASYVVPTVEANFAMCGPDIAHHTEGFREASGSPAGDAAALNAAKTLAMTAIDLLASPAAAAAVRAWFEQAKQG